jgi:pimeloyl-ACP methyl ester carboxylesterase
MNAYKGRAVTDLVVVVPGILGSRLDKDGHEIWGTTLRRLLVNVLTFGKAMKSALAIPADVDPDNPKDGVRATSLITGLIAVPGLLGMDFYTPLRLNLHRDLELIDGQLWDFAYDWRLSSRVNGALLTKFLNQRLDAYRKLPGRQDAKTILICHSMGGLVARWCVERSEGAELVCKIITIGTPHKGSILALDAIANGVRLPRKLGVDLTKMALSFPSLYELLPTYSCVELDGSVRKPLADKDVMAHVVSLCPQGSNGLQERIERGLNFHADLAAAIQSRGTASYELICFRGAEQPTSVSASLSHAGLQCHETIDGVYRGGDGVVPDDSGVPADWKHAGGAKNAGGKHSSMSNGKGLREELRVALRHAGRLMAPAVEVSVRAPTEVQAAQSFDVELTSVGRADGRVPKLNLEVTVEPMESSSLKYAVSYAANRNGNTYRAAVDGLGPGLYRLRVNRMNARARNIDYLADSLVVYEDE